MQSDQSIWNRLFLSFTLLLLAGQALKAAGYVSNVPDTRFWVTDGPVNAIAESDGVVYLGGSFHHVGPYTGGAGLVDLLTGRGTSRFPVVKGTVTAIASDAAGGWFIGGIFTNVGGIPRTNLAHVLPSGLVDLDWNAWTDNQVETLVLDPSGTELFVGGYFAMVSGVARQCLATLSPSTGSLLPWDPEIEGGLVRSLLFDGNLCYVGGAFSSIGGQARTHIAALDIATKAINPMSIDCDGQVNSLAKMGSVLYLGGSFFNIGGQPRTYLAAFDTIAGTTTGWNPIQNSIFFGVSSIIPTDDAIYVGGSFETINGQPRNNLAAISPSTGEALSWAPNPDNVVHAMILSENTLFLCGQFQSIGGNTRINVGAVDVASGEVMDWRADADGGDGDFGIFRAYAMALGNEALLVGGDFISVGGRRRVNLAALDTEFGFAVDWEFDTNGEVQSLLAAGGHLYVGGQFTEIATVARTGLAALDLSNEGVAPWNPGIDFPGAASRVQAMVLYGSTLVIGGRFNTVGGVNRQNLAAIDTGTGGVHDWAQGVDDSVQTLTISGTTVYCGGYFNTAAGQPRRFLAAYDLTNGQLLSWNPSISQIAGHNVQALSAHDGIIYVAGAFGIIGGQTRAGLAALDAATASPTSWSPVGTGAERLLVTGSQVVVGGSFTQLAGKAQNAVGIVDPVSGQLQSWNPVFDSVGSILSFARSSDYLFVGGSIWTVGGQPRRGLAAFEIISQPELRFDEIEQVGSKIQVKLSGSAVGTLKVERSPDAVDWEEVVNQEPHLGSLSFEDDLPSSIGIVIYRARIE